jgi:hypothetical protein
MSIGTSDRSAFSRAAIARLVPSWPLITGAIVFAFIAGQGRELLKDPDTYLHIAAGRWMLAHAALPAADPFSHSMAGTPWVVHEWLAELVLALVYDGAGWRGVVLITAACCALALALLLRRLLAQGEAMTSLLAVLGAGLLLEPHVIARPHLLALPVLAAWSGALIAARDGKRAPPWALLPLMTLWANLHGSFLAGLGLALYLGVEAALDPGAGVSRRAELRRWGGFATLATLAAGVTPNGIQTFLVPLRLMQATALRDSFIEWLSPNFHQFQPLELWLLALIFAGLGLGLRVPPLRLLFLLGLVHLALDAVRHNDLLAILGPLLLWASVGPQLAERVRAGGGTTLARGFAALARPAEWPAAVLTVAILAAISLALPRYPAAPPDAPATPASALAAAAAEGLSGPVLNAQLFGGYLVFRGIPTFIDGRIEMYGEAFLRRYLAAADGDEATLVALLREYRIAWTLTEPQGLMAALLDRLPGWRRVYADRLAVIHRPIDATGK